MTSVSATSSPAAAAQSTGTNALSKFAENFQDFLTLLTATGGTGLGAHTFNWNGRNDTNTLLPDGKYSVSVQGFDGAGNPVAVDTSGSGIVSNVSVVNGEIVLTVGDQKIPLSSVTSV